MRVIDENGKNLGIIEREEALRLAKEKGLDLVEISEKTDPPVAKIMDFGQFLYEQKKKKQKAKTKLKKTQTKGIRLSLRIGSHDLQVKIEQAKKFLEKGNKVKIEMRLSGREKQHLELAKNLFDKVIDKLKEIAIIDQPFTKQGGRLFLTFRKK